MSRPLRLHVPRTVYHVVARGNEKQCIFTDDVDYGSFLHLLEKTLNRFDVRCVAYCLLWNHYHLLVRTGELPLSRMMQQLNSVYCQRFNRRHSRVGHVLQGRFASRIIDSGAYARAALRYVAVNPVMAGRVQQPDQWNWSSYRATAGVGPLPSFVAINEVWSAFGTSDALIGRERFVTFVRAGLQDVFPNPLLYGSETLAKLLAPELEPSQEDREFVYLERFACRPSITDLFDGRTTRSDLQTSAYRAFNHHGYTLTEIGAVVQRAPSTIWRWIQEAADRAKGAA